MTHANGTRHNWGCYGDWIKIRSSVGFPRSSSHDKKRKLVTATIRGCRSVLPPYEDSHYFVLVKFTTKSMTETPFHSQIVASTVLLDLTPSKCKFCLELRQGVAGIYRPFGLPTKGCRREYNNRESRELLQRIIDTSQACRLCNMTVWQDTTAVASFGLPCQRLCWEETVGGDYFMTSLRLIGILHVFGGIAIHTKAWYTRDK